MHRATEDFLAEPSRLEEYLKGGYFVLGLLLAGLLGGACYFLVTAPSLEERDQLHASLVALEAKNAQSEQDVRDFEAFKLEVDSKEQELAALAVRVPLEAEKEIVAADIQNIALELNKRKLAMQWTMFDAGKPTPIQKDAPGLTTLSEVPIHTEWRGSWAGFKSVLESYMDHSRLISVPSFTVRVLKQPTREGETLEATINLKTFFKRFVAPTPKTPPVAAPQSQPPA